VAPRDGSLPSVGLAETPFGIYLHIPFCRKRCKFCYFRVYTDVAAADVERYSLALAREAALAAATPAVRGRPLRYVYFGGGTPSFLSVKQLERLVAGLHGSFGWQAAEEVTFECEPGTLSEPKVNALKALGMTRISLGVENFADDVLEANGRAHLSAEILRSWDWIKAANFPNTNIDLIAGSGSTTLRDSGFMADSSTAAAAATLQLKIEGFVNDGLNDILDTDAFKRLLVSINLHQRRNTTGI
jgi:oxygen-independent coproporphyrinogen-3 oxidase